MAVDMFLKLEGIDGETQDKDQKGKKSMDVLAWSWGGSQAGTSHMGSGSGTGKVAVQDISLTKYIDRASPTLFQFLCNGKPIDKGTLTVRKAGEKALEYIIIEMEQIIVTNVSVGGSGGEDRLTENVSLNFRKFTYSYQPQSANGGPEGGAVKVIWSIAENSA
ncbi:type VI secretion system tube protein Hcp [Methylobacterium sp. 285MFTsu5.1]|uniref:Hcp family type VI secretion system effector n=1 Tax=Methylobacterium sp. 285MFTsu5.1 TaxID=1172187 RepID=UPI00037803B6|nr:type VI secretion system tube protein Hcp [Methylobacterium sp. 285MFTsu5.1]